MNVSNFGFIQQDKVDTKQQEVKQTETKPTESHWGYSIKAYKNGQEVQLTEAQYKKLESLVKEMLEVKPSFKDLKSLNITPKSMETENKKVADTFKKMQDVLDWKPLPKIPEKSTTENIMIRLKKDPSPIPKKKESISKESGDIEIVLKKKPPPLPKKGADYLKSQEQILNKNSSIPIPPKKDLTQAHHQIKSSSDKTIPTEKEINLVTDTKYQLKPNESKHLTLIEQYKYYESFIGKFSAQVNKEIKTTNEKLNKTTDSEQKKSLEDKLKGLQECLGKLDDLKKSTLDRLVGDGGIYSKEWLKPMDKAVAEVLWSGKEEGKRLKEAKALLSDSMVEAAALLENAGVEDIGTVHYKGCDEIAKDRRTDRLNKEGQIEVKREFEVVTDKGHTISAKATTTQFADKFIGSMEKRVRDPTTGKLHGVNIQTERIIFKDKDGKEVQTTQLRSGSFDMNGIKKFDKNGKLLEQYKLPSSSNRTDLEKNLVKDLNSKELDEYIADVRTGDSSQRLASLILALKDLNGQNKLPASLDPKGWDHALQKFEGEYSDMKYNADIIELNTEVMKDTFEIAKKNDGNADKKLGYEVPDVVQGVLDTIPGLEKGKQNWGMISLQSPVNVSNKGAVNKFISLLRNQLNSLPSHPFINKLTKPIIKQLDQLVGSDTSELDPIHRELKGYEKACKETGVSNGLYINFPTNFIGAKKTLFRLGNLFEIEIPVKSLFNQGLVDKARYNEVTKKTQESAEKLHTQANSALDAVNNKLKDTNLTPTDKEALERYKNSLESLISQTFKTDNLTGKMTFASVPGEKAQYEAIGRATALMQLLGYKTTGHCRSGNNRTAAWLSKTYQIFSTMIASSDGKIPSPKETAGKLATTFISFGTFTDAIADTIEKKLDLKDKLKDDHWSLQTYYETYESSLELQEVNKGTRGTKTKVDEIGDSSFREVMTRGAFDLAGPFNEKALDKKKMKMLQEGKLTEAGINTFSTRIWQQGMMAAVGQNEKGMNDQIERLQNLYREINMAKDKYDQGVIVRVQAKIVQALDEIDIQSRQVKAEMSVK